MWLTLCGSLLFFWAGAASPSATPHLFVDLTRARISCPERSAIGIDADSSNSDRNLSDRRHPALSQNVVNWYVVSLAGVSEAPANSVKDKQMGNDPSSGDASRQRGFKARSEESEMNSQNSGKDREAFVSVVHLLPDGRWQELHLVRLELWFPTEHAADTWATRLSQNAFSTKGESSNDDSCGTPSEDTAEAEGSDSQECLPYLGRPAGDLGADVSCTGFVPSVSEPPSPEKGIIEEVANPFTEFSASLHSSEHPSKTVAEICAASSDTNDLAFASKFEVAC